MSIIKLSKNIEDVENTPSKTNTTSADYVIPSAITGSVVGGGLGGITNSGFLKNKKIKPKKALSGALGGSVVGAIGGVSASPLTSRIGNLSKYTGDKITGGTDKISDQGKSALTAALAGSGTGALIGHRLKKTKGLKGKPALVGGLAGGAGLGTSNYIFENSVQKGKVRRDENKKKREEYKELQKRIKELN